MVERECNLQLGPCRSTVNVAIPHSTMHQILRFSDFTLEGRLSTSDVTLSTSLRFIPTRMK